jgi:hypothetical protein
MKIKESKNFKIKLCVSGAAETGHCGENSFEMAEELGREIARQDAILVTGATTGFPLQAARGCKEVGGISVGFSPASSEYEHKNIYHLPDDYLDMMIYTGFGYPGRDLFLTRASDGVIIGCGRIGTIHEFTVAYEDRKPIGVLEGDWIMDETIKLIMDRSNRKNEKVIFDSNPRRLVERLILMIRRDKEETKRAYKNLNIFSGDDQEVIL